tara:strand:+ start:272 stop:754 length:483 start_codon:yes stop_codon:yes gene_type:complete
MAWYNPASWQLVDFGATPHLEDLDSAHAEWLDRIDRFSDSPAYPPWSAEAIAWAIEGAEDAREQATSAADYWGLIGEDWTSSSSRLAGWMDPDQLNKLLSLLGQSSYSAEGLAEARELGQVGTIAAGTIAGTAADIEERTRIPWWTWPAGILGLVLVLRK